MNTNNLELYSISNEQNLTELLGHFDSDFVINIIKDKIENKNYHSIPESNIVKSFEENFKIMHERFPGDGDNINLVRQRVYTEIIDILCKGHNLNYILDDNTDLYTVAYYLYDLLVSNFSNIMVNFFTSFIINNKDSIYNSMNLDSYKKNKDSSTLYNKKMYVDPKYAIISANIETVLKHISTIDITIYNVLQSTYKNPATIAFLSEIITDRGDFFRDYYCSILNRVDLLPIILTDIRLMMQRNVGNLVNVDINDFISKGEESNE